MKKFLLLIAFLLIAFNLSAQKVTGKIMNTDNQPVPYVSVQIGSDYGVVANEEGDFIIDLQGHGDADKVTFSSIGFETLNVPLANFKAGTYVLKEQANELAEVFVTNKNYTPEELLTLVTQNAAKNYEQQPVKQTFFLRNSNSNKLLDSQFELVKSSFEKKAELKEINKELEQLSAKSKNKSSQDYNEFYGFLYTYNADAKLTVEKAIELKNKEKDVAANQTSSKLVEIMKKHLDPNATYRVRSGILPVDDSLKVSSPKKDIKDDVKTADLRKSITSLSNRLNKFYTDEDLDFLTDHKKYTYTLEGISAFNNEAIYIIDFKPKKSSAHYYGKIYVNATDYAVVKLDYNLADGETSKKLNLKLILGIKMVEDRNKVSATFAKNDNGKYAVNFIKSQKGIYAYINRSLKFTKNKISKDEPDNMLKIEFLAEIDTYQTSEFFVIDKKPLSASEFNGVTENQTYKINYITKYDPSVWKDYNVLAPVQAIKDYK